MRPAPALVHVAREGDPGRPALLLLHGRGGREDDLMPLAGALDPSLGVLAPRGPEPEGAGFAWFRHHRIGVPVVESLDARLEELSGWLDDTLPDDRRLVAVGFSNGGMMAGAIAAARPDRVVAAALLSAAYPLPAHVLAAGGLDGTPVLLSAGGADPFHPAATMEAGSASYRGAGAVVTVALDPTGGHGIGAVGVAALQDWLPAVLAGARSG